ncbi:MAG: PAS domain-containing protein [Alphaproteobacteria bacterium]
MQFDPLNRGTRLFGAAAFLFGTSDNELILDAMPARVAVVDAAGRIRAVNAAWRAIAAGGDFFAQSCDRGIDYLDLCDSTLGTNARAAWVIASGLRSVLDGTSPAFQTSYVWQFGTERRGFKCLISPVGADGVGLRGAVVMHVDMDMPMDMPERVDPMESTERQGIAMIPDLPVAHRLERLAPEESARGLGMVADTVPALVAYVDKDLIYRSVNRCYQDWFGVPATDIIGMGMPDVVGQVLFRRMEPHIATALAGNRVTFEEVFRDGSGGERWFHATCIPDIDDDGQVCGFSTVAHDITALKEMAYRLDEGRTAAEQVTRTQADVLTNVGQELRAPLTSIIGFAETLAAELFGPIPDRYRSYARDIRDTACGLTDLVNDLIDLSRLHSGQFRLDELRVDVHALLTSGHGRIEQVAKAAGVRLRLAIPGRLPTLFADERVVRQVVTNLLMTMVRHAAEGGTVTLSTRRELEGTLAIVVSADALVIPQADLDRLMEPFARLDVPRRPADTGGGLALPLVRRFMEAHGGTFTLQARPKQGVVATATFPRARVVG